MEKQRIARIILSTVTGLWISQPLFARVDGIHSDLVEVLNIAGNPMLLIVAGLATIVSIIANMEKVIDKNGTGERHQGLQNIAFCVMATYLVTVVLNMLILSINNIQVAGYNFSE